MPNSKITTVIMMMFLTSLMLATGSIAGQKNTINLKYSIFFPESHIQCRVAKKWAEEINQKSDGRVHIKIYPGGSLISAPQTYESIVQGKADIGMSCFAYTKERFPVMAAADLPLGYRNGLTATRVVNDFCSATNPQALTDVKVLYLHAHGPGLLHTQKPVKTLADLQGMKIRATGLSARIVEALGATAVSMPQGKAYQALKKGRVAGTMGPMEVLKGWKQGEVINATTQCTAIGYTTTMFVVMNIKTWNRLPDDIQSLFEETSRQWIDKHGRAWDKADAAGRKYTLRLDNEIITLSREQTEAWSASVEPVIEKYIASAKDRGMPGQEYVDTLLSLCMLY